MAPPSRNRPPLADQPALPFDVGAAAPVPRERRHRSHSRGEAPVQLSLELAAADDAGGVGEPAALAPLATEPACCPPPSLPPAVAEPAAEPLGFEAEPPGIDPDPFAEIPGFAPAAEEFVLLPASLRSRLNMREFSRFLASLPSVARDWEGAPEMDDGGVRLRGAEGGVWIYPEPGRVRVVTDGGVTSPVAEDLVALCRWLESRAGMQLYPGGEAAGAGVDRSLDPWDTFLGR